MIESFSSYVSIVKSGSCAGSHMRKFRIFTWSLSAHYHKYQSQRYWRGGRTQTECARVSTDGASPWQLIYPRWNRESQSSGREKRSEKTRSGGREGGSLGARKKRLVGHARKRGSPGEGARVNDRQLKCPRDWLGIPADWQMVHEICIRFKVLALLSIWRVPYIGPSFANKSRWSLGVAMPSTSISAGERSLRLFFSLWSLISDRVSPIRYLRGAGGLPSELS